MSKTSRFLQHKAENFMSKMEFLISNGKRSKDWGLRFSLKKWRDKHVDFDLVEPFIYEVYGDYKKHNEIIERLIHQWIDSIQTNKA